jgi:hypothetical protein
MNSSDANKNGVLCRYYVSQRFRKIRKPEAGSASRISAPDAEGPVCKLVREARSRTSPFASVVSRALFFLIFNQGKSKMIFSSSFLYLGDKEIKINQVFQDGACRTRRTKCNANCEPS